VTENQFKYFPYLEQFIANNDRCDRTRNVHHVKRH